MARRLDFAPAPQRAKPPTNPPPSRTAGHDRRPEFDQPRLAVMAGLVLLALADYAATRTGMYNGDPGGNPIYACAAGVTTIALWALLPGYSPAARAATRLHRAAMYLALVGLHVAAAAIAFTPRRNPTALAVLDGSATTAVVVLMALVAVCAWWYRMTAGRES